MIDIRKLKELVRLMVENDLSELDLKDQQETVAIKRGSAATVINHQPVIYGAAGGYPGGAPHHAPPRPAAPMGGEDENGGGEAPAVPAVSAAADGLVAVESPMVGTFYTSPNPDSPPFVTVGASIGADTTVCLIEAMKVFNEIKAEINGTIERILVESGKPVEYGQKLFLVRPS